MHTKVGDQQNRVAKDFSPSFYVLLLSILEGLKPFATTGITGTYL